MNDRAVEARASCKLSRRYGHSTSIVARGRISDCETAKIDMLKRQKALTMMNAGIDLKLVPFPSDLDTIEQIFGQEND